MTADFSALYAAAGVTVMLTVLAPLFMALIMRIVRITWGIIWSNRRVTDE